MGRYLEADRSRADEYYLEAGVAQAQLSVIDGSGRLLDESALTPIRYAGWVDWVDPISGESMGAPCQAGDARLRLLLRSRTAAGCCGACQAGSAAWWHRWT